MANCRLPMRNTGSNASSHGREVFFPEDEPGAALKAHIEADSQTLLVQSIEGTDAKTALKFVLALGSTSYRACLAQSLSSMEISSRSNPVVKKHDWDRIIV